MRSKRESEGQDVHFHVPFVHRVRFTSDVLEADQETLVELLEPSGGRQARVQFWLDKDLDEARPDLQFKLKPSPIPSPIR